jgi:predicted PurR-regulated permease PerM
MLKILKEKNKFLRYFNETFKLSAGFERFLASLLIMLMICHLIACLFYIFIDFFDSSINWVNAFGFIDSSNFDVI